MKVSNSKCIKKLSLKNMKASRSRNIIAVIAIALTTVLFTSLFTIVMSVVYGYEQSNFRQVGGYEHGGLKNLTQEQCNEFCTDKRIKEYGIRMMLGEPADEAFELEHTEISSADENYLKFTFVDFAEGKAPAEGSREAAADSKVLEMLGVEAVIGTEFTMNINVAGVVTSQTFILSGWWRYDSASPCNNIFLPFSRSEEIINELGIEKGCDYITGLLSLDFMLKSGSHNIEKHICSMIEEHGFQYTSPAEPDYIGYGVNWGYLDSQLEAPDVGSIIAVVIILTVIMMTGYLIIYNVFRISVSNDIRYYGLLKTIGTTGSQIKQMLNIQALRLSLIGIPLGLAAGYGVGALLAPKVLEQLSGISSDSLSISPLIFVFSGLFSYATVIISIKKPGRLAAKISPVEAVRYTESTVSKKERNSRKGASITAMAAANLSRSRSKTILTIISLALSVVLLNLTVTFARGFDMDKYLLNMPVDMIVGDNSYFSPDIFWEPGTSFNEDQVLIMDDPDIFEGAGIVYGTLNNIWDYVPEDYLRRQEMRFLSSKEIDEFISHCLRRDGLLENSVMLYGMDEFLFDKITVIDGDMSKLGQGNYIAAVYNSDDYRNVIESSNWAKIGDIVTLGCDDSDEYIWVDSETHEVYGSYDSIPDGKAASHQSKEKHYEDFEVAAIVMVPHDISYRYYANEQFILSSDKFREFTGCNTILYAAFDIIDGRESDADEMMNSFISSIAPSLSFETKDSYEKDFAAFRNMFLLLGGVMSFIVGIVGVLNFINAILTGIISRRKEFAVLQSIGMTDRQLNKMLIIEGLLYTLSAALSSLLLFTLFSPLLKKAVEGMLWFISFRFTITPILILLPVFAVLGAVIPLISHKAVSRLSIVQRLRESES